MKKIMWFWILPSLLLVATLAFLITLPMHSKTTYESEIDNKAYEQKIKFTLQYASEGSMSENRIYLLFRNGKLTQNVDYFVNEDVSKNKKLYFENTIRTVYESESSLSSPDETCEITHKQLDEVPISYRLAFYENDFYQDIYNKEYKIATLKTDLKYKSDDNAKLVQSTQSCGNVLIDESIERVLLNDDEYVNQPFDSHFYKGYYYVMAMSDQSMSGQNKIYRIKLNENGKQKMTFNEEEVVPLVTLSQDRYYVEMMQHEDCLYVVSYDNKKTYVTQYTVEGKVMNEVEIESDGLVVNPNMKISNGHFIIQPYQQQANYFIYDVHTLAFIKNVNFDKFFNKNGYPHLLDMKYEEGALYLLYSETNETLAYADSFIGDIVVCVGDQDNLLYKGIMKSILNEKMSDYNLRLSGYFMEVGQ